MYQRKTINLGNLLLSLSDAMDSASRELAWHQLRTAFISWELARHLDLAEDEIERIYGAALLHDAGALAPSEKMRLHRFEEIETEVHCRRGELLLTSVPQLRGAAPIVRHHHTPWERWPRGIDHGAVVGSQVLHLADTVECHIDRNRFVLHQSAEISKDVRRMAGTAIHKDVVDAFMAVSQRDEFWFDLASPRLYSLLLHRGPFRKIQVELGELVAIGEMFRYIVDFRSHFTAAHSSGVAACASELGALFGLTGQECRYLQMAGDLHDLGKLCIPIEVIEKPGELSDAEAALFREHTYRTWTVLETIGGLEPIAEWAAFHHERLDGSGYPFRRGAEDLDTGSRLVAVADVFTALAEDRPYRKGLREDEVSSVLRLLATKQALDGRLVELLLDNYKQVWGVVRESQAEAVRIYEADFAPMGLAYAEAS